MAPSIGSTPRAGGGLEKHRFGAGKSCSGLKKVGTRGGKGRTKG